MDHQKPTDPLLLKPEEAARLLGVSRGKFHQLLAEGEIPCVRHGRLVRVSLSALREWIDAKSTPRGAA